MSARAPRPAGGTGADPAAGDLVLDVAGLSVDIATPHGVLHAVRNLDFQARRGETLCIVGESGCGKSMTSLAIMGLLPRAARRSARRLTFLGEDLAVASARRVYDLRGSRMAMIFQEPMTALNPAYSIGDQLMEPYLHHRRSSVEEARLRAVDLLEKVGIASARQRLGQYPHQLSGGLRQRVMIAMALMCGPELLIADEPSTALDVTIQAQILRLLAQLQRELGIAMVLITHDLGVVARIADRVAVMYAGEIVEHGPAAEVFATPHHPYTRGLLDCIPVPGRTPPGGRLGTIAGVVPSLVGEFQGCGFRDRCSYARAACALPIPLLGSANGHGWRCILPALPARHVPAPADSLEHWPANLQPLPHAVGDS
jgi:peptide/nickel transport system ATP-binding protein